MTKKMSRVVGIAVGLAILVLPCLLHAQLVEGLALEKLGVLDLRGAGARPFAMGGAYTAVSNDAFGLMYNPAGLTEITRRELTVGLHFRSDDITNKYLMLSAEHSSNNTSLDHVAVVYPYPTFRGSFVLAFGVFRVGSSSFESMKSAVVNDVPTTVEDIFEQSGDIYQYHLGIGVDLSPRIAAGLSLILWDESTSHLETIIQTDPDSELTFSDDVSVNLDGFSLNMGLLFRPSDATRIGFAFTSPAWLTYRGEGIRKLDGTFTAGGGFTTDEVREPIDDDYTLPMKFTLGASARLAPLLVAADVGYSDYSQTKLHGNVMIDETDPARERIFKAKVDVHAGAELTLPWAPVYLRGGFSYVPLPLATVEEIATLFFDEATSNVATFKMSRERKLFTCGVGGLIDGVLSIDAALSFGGYKKVTSDGNGGTFFSENRDITEFIVSGAYRF